MSHDRALTKVGLSNLLEAAAKLEQDSLYFLTRYDKEPHVIAMTEALRPNTAVLLEDHYIDICLPNCSLKLMRWSLPY